MNNIWWVILLSLLSGILNFEGREGPDTCWYKRWYVARLGVTLCTILSLWLLQGWSLWLLSLFLIYAGCSVGDFGKWCWLPQGFAVALSFGAYAFGTHMLLPWLLQILAVSLLTYLWSRSWFGSLPFWASFVRGFIYCASTLLYILPTNFTFPPTT